MVLSDFVQLATDNFTNITVVVICVILILMFTSESSRVRMNRIKLRLNIINKLNIKKENNSTKNNKNTILEKKIQENLKKEKKVTSINDKSLKDSGINISKKYFLIILFVIALPSTYFLFKVTASLPVSIIVFSFCIFFAPKMVITHFKEKKMKDFIKYFPSTIDIIVRGVRSGLPVGECFRIIRSESPKPVCDEFGLLTDSMALGMPLEEALVDMHRRIPLAEIDYLKIVLLIQKQTGGSLSESLMNLASTLRERKTIKEKTKALTAEAHFTAIFVGCLPFVVLGLIYLLNKNYLIVLFVTDLGRMILMGSAFWMILGIFILIKIIRFKL